MKVTLYTREYPPHVYGGAGVHVKFLARELAKLMAVDVACFGEQDSPGTPLSVRGYAPWPQLKGAQKYSAALETLSVNLVSQAGGLDSDIVHSHTWYAHFAGFLAQKLHGVPFVATCHSLEPLRPWKRDQLGGGYDLSAWIERTGIEAADAVVAVSRTMRDDILAHFKVDPSRVHVIHNGIDLDLWTRRPLGAGLKSAWGIADDYVLFLGRCTPQKGAETLVDAAAEIPCQVVMAMGGADTPDYEQRVTRKLAERSNIVHIKGMLTEDEAAQLYSGARAFICPSVYEPFGIINLEAMACETPVVASAVGGIVEIVVDGETGTLVPPSDPAALAAAVRRLLENPARAAEMGRAGRLRAERGFSWQSIARRTRDLYAGLIGAR